MKYQSDANELVTFVRPLFQQLVPMALKKGIMIAIVTFSGKLFIYSKTFHKVKITLL